MAFFFTTKQTFGKKVSAAVIKQMNSLCSFYLALNSSGFVAVTGVGGPDFWSKISREQLFLEM